MPKMPQSAIAKIAPSIRMSCSRYSVVGKYRFSRLLDVIRDMPEQNVQPRIEQRTYTRRLVIVNAEIGHGANISS
jgi:hypothetical protein